MPHKRPKRSVREQLRDQRETDQAPSKDSLRNEAIPKSAQRVLNALSIREAYRTKKRKYDEDNGVEQIGKRRRTGDVDGEKQPPRPKKGSEHALKILPGESIQHFNRRVEDDLRPLVKSAMQTGRSVARKVEKEEWEARKQKRESKSKAKAAEEPQLKPLREVSPPYPVDKHIDRPKEFKATSSSAPRRLNDIAQAPPELKKPPRAAAKVSGVEKSLGVLSMAQKAMMEAERLSVIARYRELKVTRRQQGDEEDG